MTLGSRRYRKRAVRLLVSTYFLGSMPAAAAPTAAEKAAAESLFQEAQSLMAAGNVTAACGKFESSYALDPGLGTKLYLADCYDRAGKSASAWALFKEAESIAQTTDQAEREKSAATRAQELEQRLSRLEIRVPREGMPPNLELTLNGSPIPSASLGSALPVDPGTQTIVARADGYLPRTVTVDVPVGPVSTAVDVPPLEREPSKPAPLSATADTPAQVASSEGDFQRVLGFATGGLGLVSLGASGFFAYRASTLDNDSRAKCLTNDPNVCTSAGASQRDEARTNGNVATGTFIAGAALVGAGLVLVFTAPSGAKTSQVGVSTTFTPGGAGLLVSGTL
jgi:hypothetical protein